MMRNRFDIIQAIGREYVVSNTESGEFSYPKAYKIANKEFNPVLSEKSGSKRERLDIRFVKGDISVLVETKRDIQGDTDAEEQLNAYVSYEKKLTGNKVIAILASTSNNSIRVYRGAVLDSNLINDETVLKPMDEYVAIYTANINNKEAVMRNTFELNKILHSYGVPEKLRSQFVGTCLLALKESLHYDIPVNVGDVVGKTVKEVDKLKKRANERVNLQIREAIKDILNGLLKEKGELEAAEKLGLLYRNVLDSQVIREMDADAFKHILRFIDENIRVHINDKSTAGQDILNLFFTTFNKYVGKADKNQAFTPDHITEFMTTISGVNKNTVVLDPTCGSGAFLVRAMAAALDDCESEEEKEVVKRDKIYGIEYDENVYGLATTNMLIHGDGNSNIKRGSCFDLRSFIREASPDVILMNPPYNAQKIHLPKYMSSAWSNSKGEDPTKGLAFVKYIADIVKELGKQAKLAVLLPVSCAIGSSKEIANMKNELLKDHTLDAVFTLPDEIFYPGASASACCMVFNLGRKHKDPINPPTFFGYFKDDGFKKKKNLGRVEQVTKDGNSLWELTRAKWLDLYINRREVEGLSAVQYVTGDDEWLCEAYMKADYSKLTEADFQQTLNNYLSYLVKEGYIYEA